MHKGGIPHRPRSSLTLSIACPRQAHTIRTIRCIRAFSNQGRHRVPDSYPRYTTRRHRVLSTGFLLALGSVATVREVLGMGTWLGFPVMPESFPRCVLMIMPPGAFLTLGVLLAAITAVASWREKRIKVREKPETGLPLVGIGEGR